MGGRLWVVGLPPALLARRQAGEVILHQVLEADRDVVVLEALDGLILVAGLDLAVVDPGVVLKTLLRIGVLDRVGRREVAVVQALLPRGREDRVVDGVRARVRARPGAGAGAVLALALVAALSLPLALLTLALPLSLAAAILAL